MAKTLTAVAVKNLRSARKGRREISDAGCTALYLIIQETGRKSWALRFRRPSGKPAKLTLGPLDLGKEQEGEPVIGQPLTLVAARRLAAEINRQRAMGRDVVADYDRARKRRRHEQQTRAASTFGAASRDFIEQYAMRETKSWRGTARLLGLDPRNELEVISGGLTDRWSDRPVAEIDRDAIHDLIDEVRAIGVPGRRRRRDGPTDSQAIAMRSCLSKMFSWLVEKRRVTGNPSAGVPQPKGSVARDRVLTDAEIMKFWSAADAEQFGPLFKLLLLTGCRLNEVAGMRRSELSEGLSTWTLSGSRTKNKRVHVVPLPPLARQLIETTTTSGDLVFTTTGTTPVSGWSPIKRRIDRAMKLANPWVFHDLRRTAATGMATIGIAPHIVEAALNHVSGARAGVAGTYNRAAYGPEKKAALERWADHVEGLVSGRPANVLPLRRGAS